MDEWARNKKKRELAQAIESYKINAEREIENNKVARKDRVRNASQRYYLICLERYKEVTGEDYLQ